ncbi:tape measure protein [Microbacterium phage Jacko]|nr:tape measure protein [Microbacterium phage Jacko]
MTEPVNVVFSISERGFDKILRDVEALRSDLEGLGVDMSAVQRRLNGIETTAVRTGRQIRNTGKTSDDAAKSARGWAESLTTVWARQFREAERAEAQIRKVAAAQAEAARSAQGGRNYRNASTSIDGVIASREAAGRDFSAQLRAQLQQNAKAADDEARAIQNATRATNARTKAEYDLARARSQRQSRQQIAEWDAEFAAVTRLASANSDVANPSTRYALYDVANAYTAIGASLAGVAVYAAVVGADFQSAFTNVARTIDPAANLSADAIDGIRSSLVQLSGQAPLTFRELSDIATIGNQMGIAEDQVISFTGTIARFASVSGVSIEETTRSFGGFIAQTGLSEQYLENLGSAMALVSIRSNATEAQIISLTREIAASANSAGFGADEIVGLAGAFASLQVAPERARGVLDTYFNRLNGAVAEGGEALDSFSRITGRSAEELNNLVRSGQGVEVFRSVLAGLKENSADVVELDQNLEALGLTGLRASNTFLRFVNSLGVADESFANARQGFIEGAELNRQYAQTVDDLSSQFVIFINGINALVDAISGGGVESLAALLQGVNNVIFAFTEWVGDNRLVANIIGFTLAVVGITGVLTLVRAGLIAATAATFAMRTAIAQMGGTALASAGTVRGLAGAIFGVKGATDAASGSLLTFRSVLRSVLASSGIGLLLVGAGALFDGLTGSGTAANDAALSLQEYEQATQFAGLGSNAAASGADNLADSLGGKGGGVSGAAEDAAEKVRTLVDYVNDLNGVFRRSEDLRFGSAAALDEITLKWLELNEEIDKYRQQVRTLTADRELKAYFLGIAEAYDDQLRAGQLREEIAQIDDKLAEAQAGASTELTGNTRAAIENRKVFRDLLGSYEDYVSALASAGASQEQIQAVISQLNSDFGVQARALGFNSSEVRTYQQRFSDLSTIIARVPRNVNVAFNADPALQALGEFFAKAEEAARQSGKQAGENFGSGFGGGIPDFPIDDFFPGRGIVDTKGRSIAGQLRDGMAQGFSNLGFAGSELYADFLVSFLGPETVLAGGKAALWFVDNFIGGLPIIGPLIRDAIRNHVGLPGADVGRETGGTIGRSVAGGISNGINSTDPVATWSNNQRTRAYNNGRGVGASIGGGILDALNQTLAYGRVKGPVIPKSGYSQGGYVDGFSSGGYTGSGHWLEPAGVVHRGEYVIPKKHVDQRTGLPDVDYVSNLRRGRSAPKTGYATGGFVGGGAGAFSGPIELGPVSLGAITNGLSVRLNVGREQLAAATSAGNSALAFTGSN